MAEAFEKWSKAEKEKNPYQDSEGKLLMESLDFIREHSEQKFSNAEELRNRPLIPDGQLQIIAANWKFIPDEVKEAALAAFPELAMAIARQFASQSMERLHKQK